MSDIPPIPPIPTISADVARRAADAVSATRGEGLHASRPTFADRLAAKDARELARKTSQ